MNNVVVFRHGKPNDPVMVHENCFASDDYRRDNHNQCAVYDVFKNTTFTENDGSITKSSVYVASYNIEFFYLETWENQ